MHQELDEVSPQLLNFGSVTPAEIDASTLMRVEETRQPPKIKTARRKDDTSVATLAARWGADVKATMDTGPRRSSRTRQAASMVVPAEQAPAQKSAKSVSGQDKVVSTTAGTQRHINNVPEDQSPTQIDVPGSGSSWEITSTMISDITSLPSTAPSTEMMRTHLCSASTSSSDNEGDEDDRDVEGILGTDMEPGTGKVKTEEDGDKEWILPRKPGWSRMIPGGAAPTESTYGIPATTNWFELLSVSDQLGPLPSEWFRKNIPRVIRIPEQTSVGNGWRDVEMQPHERLEQFAPVYNDHDEDQATIIAMKRSLKDSPHEHNRERRANSNLHAMATIVEVEESRATNSKGATEPPVSREKGKEAERGPLYDPNLLNPSSESKNVRKKKKERSTPAREFLQREASCEPEGIHTTRKENSSRNARRSKSVRFQRETSQIPEGGYFNQAREGHGGGRIPPDPPGPPNDSDDESLSSSSSSATSRSDSSTESERSEESRDETARKKRKKDQKKIKKVMNGVKLKNPVPWDGRSDLDAFDEFTYEYDTWVELNALPERLALKVIVNFLNGKARKFFMTHVATRQHKWTVPLLYEALFDYCFPEDFKLRLRERLMKSTQGIHTIFWKGIRMELRLHLIEKGKDPETTPLENLVKHVSRKEKALAAKRLEERDFTGKSSARQGAKKGSRSETQHTFQPRPDCFERAKPKGKDTPKILTKEEREKCRAEGRCFSCKELGHELQNCPDWKHAKAPRMSSSSIRFEKLDRLAETIQKNDVNVSAVRVDFNNGTHAPMHEWRRAHRDDTKRYIKALFDSYADSRREQGESSPEERFEVSDVDDESFEVIDWATNGAESYRVTYDDLEEPDLSVQDIIIKNTPHPNTPTDDNAYPFYTDDHGMVKGTDDNGTMEQRGI
ncbi:hypothetical protein BC835DRAFT_1302798 [Cytidiella melzeri]|nr:hypothetical protein BC835DRAFT_1302798 [Cytidiella melzeri]